MISANDAYDILLNFISPVTSQGTEKLLSLCTASLDKLYKRLRSDVDENDNAIAYAAACDAYYGYALSQMADIEENSDFKAGDVTVKRKIKETLSVAEKIKAQGEEAVRELLRDESFGVWSV